MHIVLEMHTFGRSINDITRKFGKGVDDSLSNQCRHRQCGEVCVQTTLVLKTDELFKAETLKSKFNFYITVSAFHKLCELKLISYLTVGKGKG